MSTKHSARLRREREEAKQARARAMSMPLSAESRSVLTAMMDSAFWTIRYGSTPGLDEWATLASMVSTVDAYALNVGCVRYDDVREELSGAHRSLTRAKERFLAGHAMRLDGPGLACIESVYAVYRQCLNELTAGEVSAAFAAAYHLQIGKDMRAAEEIACV